MAAPGKVRRARHGGVWAPGGPPGLQNRRTARSVVGGFDSRPPPPPVLHDPGESTSIYGNSPESEVTGLAGTSVLASGRSADSSSVPGSAGTLSGQASR